MEEEVVVEEEEDDDDEALMILFCLFVPLENGPFVCVEDNRNEHGVCGTRELKEV